jgi:hypothetical protein
LDLWLKVGGWRLKVDGELFNFTLLYFNFNFFMNTFFCSNLLIWFEGLKLTAIGFVIEGRGLKVEGRWWTLTLLYFTLTLTFQ